MVSLSSLVKDSVILAKGYSTLKTLGESSSTLITLSKVISICHYYCWERLFILITLDNGYSTITIIGNGYSTIIKICNDYSTIIIIGLSKFTFRKGFIRLSQYDITLITHFKCTVVLSFIWNKQIFFNNN